MDISVVVVIISTISDHGKKYKSMDGWFLSLLFVVHISFIFIFIFNSNFNNNNNTQGNPL